ncbi:hypothetical protein EW093_05530 [Thiospirochaeta perfilievii]|uniref:Uncharacterized protein n=1 Tax=Thiospirochaeta perfilievii TaxID=252967 RepID=A0A5C1QBS9_9SPIO|nr:hypothetical protein [Thiospirochaeta perfilievii]QEN04186.1 hypothetical protein EW093_05530 [Thiospirochaeta perfilievii]
MLKIISEKYLFENDMFITKSPSKFLSFFKKSFSRDEIKSFKELEFEEDAKFSGIDKDGNYYWTSYAGCFVFDKTGKLLTLFVIDFKEARRSDMPRFAIDNDGNAYRLIKGEDCYYLKMVKRYW